MVTIAEYAELSFDGLCERLPEVISEYPVLLQKLSPRQREVIELRFGLHGTFQNLRDIGRKLKFSETYIRCVEETGLECIWTWVRALAIETRQGALG